MPSTFQTCLLVTALAGLSNGQAYLHLESQPVDNRAVREQDNQWSEYAEHRRLDHRYDGEYERYVDRDE